MKAGIATRYGGPEVFQVVDRPKPSIERHEILLKVKASAVNSADVRLRKAEPFLVRLFFGLFKPKYEIPGIAFSGIVEEVGQAVTEYKKGQEIWGLSETTLGAYAEYLVLNDKVRYALKPANLSHKEAASVPFGFHTALHFLNKITVTSGQNMLIYGASGAVGVAAVQLAKLKGLSVTAVASSKNHTMLKGLGADVVLDYKSEQFKTLSHQYDFVIETVSKLPAQRCVELTKENGSLILVAGVLWQPLQANIAKLSKKITIITGVAECTPELLDLLKTWFEQDKLKTIIDRVFTLENLSHAHAYVDKGHKAGNVVIHIN